MSDKDSKFDKDLKSDVDGRLQDINKRLGRDVDPELKERSRRRNSAGMALALRVASEFVSAILVGAAIGYGIDWLLGSSPWVMILFLLLGFAAGVMNVMRSAGDFSTMHDANGNEGN